MTRCLATSCCHATSCSPTTSRCQATTRYQATRRCPAARCSPTTTRCAAACCSPATSRCQANSCYGSPASSVFLCYLRCICSTRTETVIEPCHEIIVLSVLRKLILLTGMRSHPVRFWSNPWSGFKPHVCEQRNLWRDCADAQARLSLCWSHM